MADNTSQLKKLVLDLTGLEVKKGAVIRTALKAKIPVKDLDLYNFLRYLVGSDRRFIRFKTEFSEETERFYYTLEVRVNGKRRRVEVL